MYKPDTIIFCPVCDGEGYIENCTQSRHEVDDFECPICAAEGEITLKTWAEIPEDYDPIEDIRDNQIMAAEYAWEASIGK